MKTGILLIQCQDQKGLLAAICQFIDKYNGNITSMSEYADTYSNRFFSRVEWEMEGFDLQEEDSFQEEFISEVAEPRNMDFQYLFSEKKTRTAIFVSKYTHCIEDLFYRYKNGELNIEIPLVISNHDDLRPMVEQLGIPYHHIKITKANKVEQEARQRQLLNEHKIDLVVLARYMQILSEDFVTAYKNQIINIHHSFLPAFTGAKPYHAAYERGVKIIGATAHFVTADLDEGPIICQDVTQTTHRDSIKDMVLKGRDVEKAMLSKAVNLFANHKILVSGNKTVVFD